MSSKTDVAGDQTVSFCPEVMHSFSELVEALHLDLLKVDIDPADPVAEEHFAVAVALLRQAKSHLRLAEYAQAGAICFRRTGR